VEAFRKLLLRTKRYPDARFLAIDFIGKEGSIGRISSRVGYPVIQDTKEMGAWKKLNGKKDDMYVLDRCGKVIFHIPARNSNMKYPTARLRFLYAYNRLIKCPGCQK